MAGDVLCGYAADTFGEGPIVAGPFMGGEFALGMGVEIGAIAVEREHEQQFRIQARGRNSLHGESRVMADARARFNCTRPFHHKGRWGDTEENAA